jgi:hypothetical protein
LDEEITGDYLLNERCLGMMPLEFVEGGFSKIRRTGEEILIFHAPF